MKKLVLGEVLEVLIDHRGKTPNKLGSDFKEQGIPVASAVLVKNGKLDLLDARCIDEQTYRRWMPEPVKHGDVLLTSEAPLGRVARVANDTPLALGQRLYGLRGRTGVLDSGYLYYALQTDGVQADLIGHSTGTTVFGIRQSALRKVLIPAPEFSVQQAIAEVLGALDNKIAANDRVAAAALSLGDAHHRKCLSEVEGVRRTIGELAGEGVLIFGDGYRTKRSEHGEPGLRILRAGDVKDFTIAPDGDDYVSDSYLYNIGKKSSQPGDIILTTKGTVGRTAVVPSSLNQVVYSPQICYFRVVDQTVLDWGYLAAWFRSHELQTQIAPLMFNSDMAPYINLKNVRSLELIVPPREDQTAIGELQSSLLARFDAAQVENRQIARTRDELLPLLMSGKLRVRDAERTVEEVV